MPETESMSGPVQPVKPEWSEVKQESKFWRKAKEAPFVPLGILGLIGAVSYGAFMYKRRGQMSTSVYVMQFRVISQSMVVGAMTIGVGVSILPKLWKKLNENSSDSGSS